MLLDFLGYFISISKTFALLVIRFVQKMVSLTTFQVQIQRSLTCDLQEKCVKIMDTFFLDHLMCSFLLPGRWVLDTKFFNLSSNCPRSANQRSFHSWKEMRLQKVAGGVSEKIRWSHQIIWCNAKCHHWEGIGDRPFERTCWIWKKKTFGKVWLKDIENLLN